MRRTLFFLLLAAAVAPGSAVAAPPAAAPSFASEQLTGTLADDNWEPITAADPHGGYVYQAVTGIGAHECDQHNCPGTSILVRASSDGGTTWGPFAFACGIACKNVGWQFDPQLAVASDGTVYAAWLNTFNPGTVLSKSFDHGRTWTTPVTTNGSLTYNDKPILAISLSGKDVYLAFDDKADAYAVASHDYGASFSAPVKTNNDSFTYLAYGGIVAPNGNVYFAETGEGKNGLGPEPVALVGSSDGGQTWKRTILDTSQDPPLCNFKGCYADFFSSQATIASDSTGHLIFAYLLNSAANAPKSLYVRTSTDGINWSARSLVNSRGDSNMPAIAAGPSAGDFRLAWQDDRNGTDAWNTWYARTTNGGALVVHAGTPVEPRIRCALQDRGRVHVPVRGLSRSSRRSCRHELRHLGEGNGIYTGGGTGGSWWARGR